MRMCGQPIVGVLFDAMMGLAGLVRRIDVDDDERQMIQMMKELVADLGRDRMRLRDRQLRMDGDIQFGMQAVPEPARPHLGDLLHLSYVLGSVAKLIDDPRLGTVEHADEDRLSTLDNDAEDRRCNQQPHDGIGQRVAKPNADRSRCPHRPAVLR
jgi:hypothetical protein